MLKKSLIFIFLLVFISAAKLTISQDTSIVKYYPLSIGNVWVYDRQQSPNVPPGPGKGLNRIVSTSVINNHLYYLMMSVTYLENGSVYSTYYANVRVDSVTGNLYSMSGNDSCVTDILRTKLNDSAYATCEGKWMKCIDTSTYAVFGQNPKSKQFMWSNYFEIGSGRVYAKNIGVVKSYVICPTCSQYSYLRGCKINGVLYGDTNLVSINSISTEVPKSFSLYQNYPNPFNPSTKIKFDIPNNDTPPLKGDGGMTIKLSIYNSLGQEVAVLVNEQLQPGTYEVDWNAADMPSGVYYYKLTAGEFVETKKIALLK
jgi:hypothetical protein